MSVTTEEKPAPQRYRIPGIYSIQDIKFDILKIIDPYDGYMYNKKVTLIQLLRIQQSLMISWSKFHRTSLLRN